MTTNLASRTNSMLPLCVDLDGTLIKTDTMFEGFLKLCRTNLLTAFLAPFWLLRGRAYAKSRIFDYVKLDLDALPYNEELISFLREEKEKGRDILLVTGASEKVAHPIAEKLGFFSKVFASNIQTNLTGRKKSKLLQEQFGDKKFAYVGDSWVDLKVWKHAGEAFVVSSRSGLEKKAAKVCPVAHVFYSKVNLLKLLLKAIRLHQWTKNILILAPLILAHKLNDFSLILKAFHALFAFSLISSSVYLLNDLLDLEADRRHPDNKKRPFASGQLPLLWGLILSPLFLAAGIAASLLLSEQFMWVVACYYVVTLAYSLHLKQIVLADIIILGFLYSWRLVAGAAATNVTLSVWFIMFAGFFFFSLALVKRCSELKLIERTDQRRTPRRGYSVEDFPQLMSFGTASGYISVFVLILYINNSDQVNSLYKNPTYLLFMCPFLLYWISRMWLKAFRGKMYTDPLVFALKDKVSYIMIGMMCFIWLLASGFFPFNL